MKGIFLYISLPFLASLVLAYPQSEVKIPIDQSATTEESQNAPISDLEASFGGTSSTTRAPETTTLNRRTGFYYLLDWNSFLDVDDVKGNRVNLRFQPKVGDPKRFFKVTTP